MDQWNQTLKEKSKYHQSKTLKLKLKSAIGSEFQDSSRIRCKAIKTINQVKELALSNGIVT